MSHKTIVTECRIKLNNFHHVSVKGLNFTLGFQRRDYNDGNDEQYNRVNERYLLREFVKKLRTTASEIEEALEL